MKLRTRVIIVIVVTTLCLSAILFTALESVFSHNYSQIENSLMMQNLERIQFAIDREEITLNQMAANYSSWDETYNFVIDGNQDYIDNYFTGPTFTNSEINIFAVINNSGQVIYCENYDLINLEEIPVPEDILKSLSNGYLLARDQGKGKFGILNTSEGPLLFGTGPILTSLGEGPIRGTVFMGKILDQQLTEKLGIITKLSLEISQFTDVNNSRDSDEVAILSANNHFYIKPLDSKTLVGYVLISDFYGTPYLVASTQTARDIYSQSRMTLLWLLCGIALVTVFIIVVIIRLMDRLVLYRLGILSKFATGISQDGNLSSRVSIAGKDELADLGNEMNAMLSKLSSANAQLVESESKYSTLVEKSNDGIVLISNRLVVYANPRMLQMVGIKSDEYLASPFIIYVSQQYRDKVNYYYASRLSGNNTNDSYEIEIDRQDKTAAPVEINAKIIKLNGQDCDMVIIRDISERKKAECALKESEEKYRSLVNHINLGVYRLSPGAQGRFIEVNPAVEAITGYSREELLGMPVINLYLHPEQRQELMDQMLSTIQRTKQELSLVKKDKTVIIVSISASAVRDDDGNIIYFDGIIEDITYRKAMETRINDLYEKEKIQRQELQEEAQDRNMFIDILAHELRNPLTPIVSASDVLQIMVSNDSNETRKKLIFTIREGAEKMARKLEELLDLARHSRGNFNIKRQPTEIRPYLEGVISRFKPSIQQRDQRLIMNIEESLPPAEIDPSHLEQVLVNLLSNASKYSPEGSDILLNVFLQDGELQVEVKDNGVGISPEEQKRIFQPYHRVGQNQRKTSGLGLGLTVAKKIVEAHGGTIWVDSQSDQGSTFSFRIPIHGQI